jgi:DNA-binding response OmpR family regulator
MSSTILLADDSVTIRKVVELSFMDESFDLISVGSGSEALERFDPGVDLVIADVHMPGADGYEVCESVKKKSPGTPVLLLVGTFETYDEQRASDAGADDHLKKPFDSQDLLSRVNDLLARSTTEVGESQPTDQPGSFGVESGFLEAGDGGPDQVPRATVGEAEPEEEQVEVTETSDGGETGSAQIEMSDEAVDRIARRVVELLSEDSIREVAWEVIPDLAEVVIKERLNELERQVE